MIGRLAVVALVAASTARADTPRPPPPPTSEPPDPAVDEAGDANLESTAERSGLTFAGSLGGGMILGFGINSSAGRGGAVSLRLGHVATPRTVITFELDVTLALHKPEGESVQTNSDTNLLAGAQYYVGPSLWLRFAGGVGIYQGRRVLLSSVQIGDVTLVGPAAFAGIGLDVARFKWAVLGIEAGTSAIANRDGLLLASSINVGVAFD